MAWASDVARRVWNRASYGNGSNLLEGDRALAALLLVDGYIQNGGVAHAFDLAPEQLAEGLKAYEFFELHDMAAVIRSYRREDEREANKKYYRLTREPNQIKARFEEMFRDHPERFAPLTEPAAG